MLEATLRGHIGLAPIEAQLLEDGEVVAEWQWNAQHFVEFNFHVHSFLFT